MKVLVWSPRGVGESYGGPSMNAHRLLSVMDNANDYVLAHGNAAQEPSALFSEAHFIYQLRHHSPLQQAIYVSKGTAWVKREAARFDVAFGIEGFHPTVAPLYAGQMAGLPALVFLAAYRTDLADKKGLPTLLGFPARRRAMAARLSGLVALSSAMEQELLEYGIAQEKIARIPIGVDTSVFHAGANEQSRSEERRRLGIPDRPSILFVGGLNQRKRPHLLVEALAGLKRKGIDAQLVLVGPEQDAEYCQSMRSHAEANGVAADIVWYGFTREVAPLFRIADIYALISRNEGMPSALIEAMASSLPSVVTRISGVEDVIEHDVNGMFVDDEGSEVERVLERYLRDPALGREHGQQARRCVEARLSLAKVSGAYAKLFELAYRGGNAAEASLLA